MKNRIIPLILSLLILSCKTDKTQPKSQQSSHLNTEVASDQTYPTSIATVFEAHGGIDQWHSMKQLSFSMIKSNGKEIITTDLKTRHERIDNPTYTLGYDGSILWVSEKNEQPYKGNAWFYKGLFSYFYAMPFLLADKGIIYEDAPPLEFEGATYPGVLISYESGVGVSPNDQYVIYYDKQTGLMQWLAYTVTFGKHEKSNNFSYIRYNNWQTINGLKLPKSIDWYKVENNKPSTKKNTIIFEDVTVLENQPAASLFEKPIKAKVIPFKS